MNDPIENLQALTKELRWLKLETQANPSPWAYSRIAEIEGMLAAFREESSWKVTQGIIQKLRNTKS